MTLDEQMNAIARLGASEHLPYRVSTDAWIEDGRDATVGLVGSHGPYIVACANAAPDLVEEVIRLRRDVTEATHALDSALCDLAFLRRYDGSFPKGLTTLRRLVGDHGLPITVAFDKPSPLTGGY